jgi:glycosyltransferase involved in cell wall biosynthesis
LSIVDAVNEKKIKVAMFLGNLGTGGAERVFVNLANALALEGFATTILVGTLDAAAYTETILPEVTVCELGVRHMRSAVFPLIRFLRRERPAVLISALEHVNLAAILAAKLSRTGTPVLATIHQTLSSDLKTSRSFHKNLTIRVALKFTPMADQIVAVSHGTADDFARLAKISRERVRVIYNPVIGPVLYRGVNEPLDHPWFQERQPPVVLGVGRLTAQKDFPNLIRAFALLRKTTDARLVILGDGEDRPSLERLVLELKLSECVSIPGVVSNPYAYMRRASLFVLSSAWEALPTVLIEAMACGCPVVSTDCPNGPAEILDNGRLGRLVPVGDVEALARAMKTSLAESHSPVPPEVLLPYTLDYAAEQYCQLITEMLHV